MFFVPKCYSPHILPDHKFNEFVSVRNFFWTEFIDRNQIRFDERSLYIKGIIPESADCRLAYYRAIRRKQLFRIILITACRIFIVEHHQYHRIKRTNCMYSRSNRLPSSILFRRNDTILCQDLILYFSDGPAGDLRLSCNLCNIRPVPIILFLHSIVSTFDLVFLADGVSSTISIATIIGVDKYRGRHWRWYEYETCFDEMIANSNFWCFPCKKQGEFLFKTYVKFPRSKTFFLWLVSTFILILKV